VRVYWLEQTEGDVPPNDDWLSANERLCLARFRFPKRRADWRLGRWTAKCALARLGGDSRNLACIEIRAAPCGAPEAVLEGCPAPFTISLSHRSGRAVCAVAPRGAMLGCDLERAEPHSQAFVADYLTIEEQHAVRQVPDSFRQRAIALMWSAKESALKSLREGLRLDTRCVAAVITNLSTQVSSWHRLSVCHGDERIFHGWWRESQGFVRTTVTFPPAAPPVQL
jgi:4'-phosphopantetheinyl transferase